MNWNEEKKGGGCLLVAAGVFIALCGIALVYPPTGQEGNTPLGWVLIAVSYGMMVFGWQVAKG